MKRIDNLGRIVIPKEIRQKLEIKTGEPNFWDNQQSSGLVLTKMKHLQNKLAKYKKIEKEYENLVDLNELLLDE